MDSNITVLDEISEVRLGLRTVILSSGLATSFKLIPILQYWMRFGKVEFRLRTVILDLGLANL